MLNTQEQIDRIAALRVDAENQMRDGDLRAAEQTVGKIATTAADLQRKLALRAYNAAPCGLIR